MYIYWYQESQFNPWLEHAPDSDLTHCQLIEAARITWANIREELLTNLSAIMPHRDKYCPDMVVHVEGPVQLEFAHRAVIDEFQTNQG